MPVIHDTPGEIDIRAFTVFGLHAKPNSNNPIGRFGTGLKNAVAVLLRHGLEVRVFTGGVEYEFYTKPGDFRGAEYDQIMMRKRKGLLRNWSYEKLPFTTQLGAHWEMWQAFRELHSNTLDEGGTSQYIPGVLDDNTIIPNPGRSRVAVVGAAYELAFMERDQTFLPRGLTAREGDEFVQVFNEPSKYLYWRGIRVFTLEEPSIYTYNILDNLELTEDRTLKHVWTAQEKLAKYVSRSKDRKFINAVVSADPKKHFEGRIDFDYTFSTPSEEFNEVVMKKKSRGAYVSPRALSYYDRYAPREPLVSEETLVDKLRRFAYDSSLPEEVQETFKHLLRCQITEPSEYEDVAF